jgi:hypothetical protein
MGKAISPATELRHVKRELKELNTALRETRIQLQEHRSRTNRAEGEVSEWKKRFDLLLKREPLPLQVTGPAALDPDQCGFCGARHGMGMPCPKLAPMCNASTSGAKHE